MKFSVIMASRLIPYPNCASNLDLKLRRAIEGVLNQTFTDFELIIVSDECPETEKIVKEYNDNRIRLFSVKHYVLFDNLPRNTGIDNAKGEFIIYCDIDDFWGKRHLEIIERNLDDVEWVCYNDIVYDRRAKQWIERSCNVNKQGACGTSNVCHSARIKWERPGYAHDYYFIQRLRINPKYKKIETPEYFVCHIPGNYDV